MSTPFETYLSHIEAAYRRGNATEHTYRPALKTLLEALSAGVQAANDPKHIACGAPDFVVERGRVPLGYVETKDVGVDLDRIERSEQLARYLGSLNNLILTDYLEFRWYVNGRFKLGARLATIGKDGKLAPDPAGLASAAQLFREFYQTETPIVGTPKELAGRMAQLARLVRGLISNALQAEDSETGALHRQFKAFQQYLLPTLKPEGFADLYAQTMAYGLFAAKLSAPPNAVFNRTAAYQYLAANRFLRKLFLDVGEELDDTPIAPFLDDLASLLARADMAAILTDFGRRTRTEDPVVHFYETFLAEYDRKLRKSRGVYYTPEPVVQFIVNSVDWLLQERFGRAWGLAAPDVHLLDPATGTGTFLYYALRAIHQALLARGQGGAWPDYVREKLLPRLFGFELLMAPYVIAHLKLGLLLHDLGYQMGKDDRLRVYLTNTLDEGVTHAETLGDLGWYISQEASDAAQVKKHTPIMVVLGNPPYANFGMLNKNDWIRELLEDYKRGLHEKKINLDDDFIKFIRFGQWRIDKTGQGILAFITNNTYIDGITHRQMRRSLMETFTDIYILDLHGSSKKKEKAPDGSKDENVFDIQQGVAIGLFVKEPGKPGPARVHHAELWGTRESKYEALSRESVATVSWKPLEPAEEQFFLVPKEYHLEEEFQTGWKLTEAFPLWQNAVKTDRDSLFFDFDRAALLQRIRMLYSPDGLDPQFRATYRVDDSSSYNLLAKRRLTAFAPSNVHECLYRPFDRRWLYYAPGITSRPAVEVMRHMLGKQNLAMLVSRQVVGEFRHFFVADGLANINSLDTAGRFGSGPFIPLYLYTTPADSAGTLFAQSETTRAPNLAPAFVAACSARLGLEFVPDGVGDLRRTFGPEDVFHYAYALFHSPTYRARYAEFLKTDFPRLPLTSDRRLFAALAAKGAELVGLHLLRSPALDNLITTYPVQGTNRVEKVQYAAGRLWINAAQYFGDLPEEVWAFRVGGYQVCDKWLKDRKGRTLSGDEIMHYQRVVVALQQTIRLMGEIERAIPGWPIA
jgi:predicted helicase